MRFGSRPSLPRGVGQLLLALLPVPYSCAFGSLMCATPLACGNCLEAGPLPQAVGDRLLMLASLPVAY
jgi:hypothetical protein